MVGFNYLPFKVLSDEGWLPMPVPDDRGWLRYSARIDAAITVIDTLVSYQSVVTELPAIGIRNGGLVIVEAGTGAATLTIPRPVGGEASYSAVLTSIEPLARMLGESHAQADVSFVIIEES